jgi:hypothetical protein
MANLKGEIKLRLKMNWKKIGRFLVETLTTLCILGILATPIVVMFGATGLISTIENKIEILDYKYRSQLRALTDLVIEGFTGLAEQNEQQTRQIKYIVEDLDKIIRRLETTQSIDVREVVKIKQANVLIGNYSAGCQGSGSHIRLNGKSYILT